MHNSALNTNGVKTNQSYDQQASAGPHDDEMLNAVEQIRQRHLNDMQREKGLEVPHANAIALVKDTLSAQDTTEFLLLSL